MKRMIFCIKNINMVVMEADLSSFIFPMYQYVFHILFLVVRFYFRAEQAARHLAAACSFSGRVMRMYGRRRA